jgi:tartrate/fumarate subfamily iron-sulfur-dependent hydro-lyase beta chain
VISSPGITVESSSIFLGDQVNEIHLKIPLSEEDARGLQIGDVVYLSGPIFTGRSLFHIRAIDHDTIPPIDYERVNVLFHAGPMMTMKDNSWMPVSMTLTASIRFEKYCADVIRKLVLRAVVGKTTLGLGSMKVMEELGAVHLTSVGIMTNILPAQVKEVLGVHFLDEIGKTEASWVMQVENAGPFLVDIDTRGNNLFYDIREKVKKRFKSFYEKYGIPEDFKYTDVNCELSNKI